MRCTPVCGLFLAVGWAGCMLPPTSSQRLSEDAYDLNTAARFGRMDLALEHISGAFRDEFSRKHASWGKTIRVVDYEFGGVTIRKDGDADVVVTVSWQPFNETTMRTTEVAQRWSHARGTWSMLREDEKGGDAGLLSEVPKAQPHPATPASPPGVQRPTYQTKVIVEQ